MEFVTIHDLSRELDVSARVIRYHLTRLIAAGKLKNEDDYRRDDFKDPLHFEWRINPASFMRESGLKPKNSALKFADHLGNDSLTPVNNTVDEPLSKPVQPVIEPPPIVTQPPNPVIQSVDQSAAISSLHREIIDTLKEQVHVKDEQIRDLSKQNRDANELNFKLNSALLQQGTEIKKLLQLTGGKMEFVNHEPPVVNKSGNAESAVDNAFVDERNQNGEASETAAMAA